MKISRKGIIISFIVGVILLIAIIMNVRSLRDEERVLFHDNASFDEFTEHKITPFSLNTESVAVFHLKCKIESGEVIVNILDMNGDVICGKNEMSYSEEIKIILAPGTYYYDLLVDHAQGSFEFKGVVGK